MIIGAHIMLQSTNGDADKKFLTEVLNLPSVNAGGGYMIFGIPPAEVSIHGSDRNDVHQLFLMCDDIAAFTGEMTRYGIAFSTPERQSWGTATQISLPGGGRLGVYQPRHPRPEQPGAKQPAKRGAAGKAKRPAKKLAKKAAKKAAGGRKTGRKTKAAKKRQRR